MAALDIGAMRPDEVALAVEWAAAEGWNPGLHDAECFTTVDPAGFLAARLDGEMVAAISVANYDAAFAFLGFYIVPPAHRGRGYGYALWQAGMAHAGGRIVGLDGVPAQQDNYRRSGFDLAWRNIRYGGTVAGAPLRHHSVAEAADLPFAMLEASDRQLFPAARTAFLRCWLSRPGHTAHVLMRGSEIGGYGVIRACREGYKVGPLFADDAAGAEILFDGLVGAATGAGGGGTVFLDVPEPNAAARALAEARGMLPSFETARMYARGRPDLPVGRMFGVTSFELG